MKNRYNKEYEQYYIYALEQFLIKSRGYSEYDAKVKVMQSFEEVKEADEGTRRLFDESVSRPINQLITEIIRRLKSSIHYQENSLCFEKVHEQMVETLSKVNGFKAYLSEIHKGQLDKLFDLPDAHRESI